MTDHQRTTRIDADDMADRPGRADVTTRTTEDQDLRAQGAPVGTLSAHGFGSCLLAGSRS